MLYLTQSLFLPWLLAALALGVVIGWRTARQMPRLEGLGWLGAGLGIFTFGLFLAGALALPGRWGLWLDSALHFLFWYIVGCALGSFLSFLGALDGTTEPVAAWVKPVRTEALAAEAPQGILPNWIRPSLQSSAGTGPVPALQAARDWLNVLRRPGEAATPVPAWVKPLPETAAGAAPATATIDRTGQWQAVKSADSLSLTGQVADDGSRAGMLAEARKLMPSLAIDDRLSIGRAPTDLAPMTSAALGHLAKLDRGIASLVDGRYTLTGSASSARNRDAVMKATQSLPQGYSLAHVDLAQSGKAEAAPKPAQKPAPAPAPAPASADEPAAAPAVANEAAYAGKRPPGLVSARKDKADDLKRIKGIGRQNESRLNSLGIWHFDQVAAWTTEHALWVGSYLAFPGRIEREDWVSQAKRLAAGEETEFSKRVDKGLVATSKKGGA